MYAELALGNFWNSEKSTEFLPVRNRQIASERIAGMSTLMTR